MDGFNWCTIIDVRAPSNLWGGDFLARKNYAMPESVRVQLRENSHPIPGSSHFRSFFERFIVFSSHLYTTYDYIYFNTLLNLVLQYFLYDSTSPKAFIIIVLIMKGCLSLCLHSWWAPGKFKRYKKNYQPKTSLSEKNVLWTAVIKQKNIFLFSWLARSALFPVKCEMANLFLVNRDFHSNHAPKALKRLTQEGPGSHFFQKHCSPNLLHNVELMHLRATKIIYDLAEVKTHSQAFIILLLMFTNLS